MRVILVPLIGNGRAVEIPAAQVLILNDEGQPVSVSGMYGPERAIRTAHVQDADFNQALRAFGFGRYGPIAVDTLDSIAPPNGSKILTVPSFR